MVTLIVSLVPWRLVGAAETWRALLFSFRFKPLRKTLMTGCYLPPNACTILVLTAAQFSHALLVCSWAE